MSDAVFCIVKSNTRIVIEYDGLKLLLSNTFEIMLGSVLCFVTYPTLFHFELYVAKLVNNS